MIKGTVQKLKYSHFCHKTNIIDQSEDSPFKNKRKGNGRKNIYILKPLIVFSMISDIWHFYLVTKCLIWLS